MEHVESHSGKELWIHQYKGEDSLQLPFTGEFVCVVWNESNTLLSAEITRSLLENGCRYVLCAGNISEKQERSVDELHVERTRQNAHTPHVMTTAHADESIEEVIDFALNATDFEETPFSKYLVLYIEDTAI